MKIWTTKIQIIKKVKRGTTSLAEDTSAHDAAGDAEDKNTDPGPTHASSLSVTPPLCSVYSASDQLLLMPLYGQTKVTQEVSIYIIAQNMSCEQVLIVKFSCWGRYFKNKRQVSESIFYRLVRLVLALLNKDPLSKKAYKNKFSWKEISGLIYIFGKLNIEELNKTKKNVSNIYFFFPQKVDER